MQENEELTILDLNDYCLSEIFKHLKFADLIQLFQVHEQFYGGIGMALSSVCVILSDTIQERKKTKIENFLKTFGNQIVNMNLCFSRSIFGTRLMKIIKTYCCNGNAKKLKFYTYKMDTKFVSENLVFFKSIKSLTFYDINMQSHLNLKMCLKSATEIKHLVVCLEAYDFDVADLLADILCIKLEKLEINFAFDSRKIKFDKLPFNSTITNLKLELADSDDIFILTRFQTVQSLSLYIPCLDVSLEPILQLTSLRQLKFCFDNQLCEEDDEANVMVYYSKFFSKLAETGNLEELNLEFSVTEEVLASSCKMSTLKKLRLEVDFSLEKLQHLLTMAYNLNNLRELIFSMKKEDVPDYKIEPPLLGILSIANHLNMLTLCVDGKQGYDYIGLYRK